MMWEKAKAGNVKTDNAFCSRVTDIACYHLILLDILDTTFDISDIFDTTFDIFDIFDIYLIPFDISDIIKYPEFSDKSISISYQNIKRQRIGISYQYHIT